MASARGDRRLPGGENDDTDADTRRKRRGARTGGAYLRFVRSYRQNLLSFPRSLGCDPVGKCAALAAGRARGGRALKAA